MAHQISVNNMSILEVQNLLSRKTYRREQIVTLREIYELWIFENFSKMVTLEEHRNVKAPRTVFLKTLLDNFVRFEICHISYVPNLWNRKFCLFFWRNKLRHNVLPTLLSRNLAYIYWNFFKIRTKISKNSFLLKNVTFSMSGRRF